MEEAALVGQVEMEELGAAGLVSFHKQDCS